MKRRQRKLVRKTMPFTPGEWRKVSRLVESGRYRTWPEVISAGLRSLDTGEAEIGPKIEEGWQAAQAGRVVNGPMFMNGLIESVKMRKPRKKSA